MIKSAYACSVGGIGMVPDSWPIFRLKAAKAMFTIGNSVVPSVNMMN